MKKTNPQPGLLRRFGNAIRGAAPPEAPGARDGHSDITAPGSPALAAQPVDLLTAPTEISRKQTLLSAGLPIYTPARQGEMPAAFADCPLVAYNAPGVGAYTKVAQVLDGIDRSHGSGIITLAWDGGNLEWRYDLTDGNEGGTTGHPGFLLVVQQAIQGQAVGPCRFDVSLGDGVAKPSGVLDTVYGMAQSDLINLKPGGFMRVAVLSAAADPDRGGEFYITSVTAPAAGGNNRLRLRVKGPPSDAKVYAYRYDTSVREWAYVREHIYRAIGGRK